MKTISLNRILSFTILIMIVALIQPGCDLIDASKVENPQITDENIRSNPVGGATAVITGLRRQFTVTVGIQSLIGDLVSDNLDNRTSFYENALDLPTTITPISFTYGAAYEGMLVLNAIADFGLAVIIPADPTVTNNQLAEIHFYKGMALLLLGENYRSFPIVEQGVAVTSAQAIQSAVTEFNTGLSLVPATVNATNQGMRANCQLGLARAYRMLGDKANAQIAANAALGLANSGTFTAASYVFRATFDAASVTSTLHAALVSRASNDIQPLPRLDFLDPKVTTNTTPTPVLKAEEAHLILAEIEISNGNLTAARTNLTNAVALATGATRTRVNFTDSDTRSTRPNVDTIQVRSDSTYPAVAGLVRRRSGTVVLIPNISWTSQTAGTITALGSLPAGANQGQQNFEHFRTLYLMRQEIFFGEGRRMCDLGIRLPVTQRQIDGNASVGATNGVSVLVPAWIPATDEMKRYTGPTAGVVTITWDMNKRLALNRAFGASPFGVIP